MKYYDYLTPADRWDACADLPVEFITAARIMSEYIAEGDKLLDMDGDVGRFALYFADMGCRVTLVDASLSAVEFAKQKATASNTDIQIITGGVNDVSDKDFDFVIARAYASDLDDTVGSIYGKIKDGGCAAIWVISQGYDMQKLLDICPTKLPSELIPNDPKDMFVDVDGCAQCLAGGGFSIERVFSPSGILAHADRSLTACSGDAFVRLMDISMNMCEMDKVLATSACVVFICRKSK